jgi:ABC-type uncharacterized transport system permease subunit
MPGTLVYSLAALATLVPACVQSMRLPERRDFVFWATVLVAVVGPGAWTLAQVAASWNTSLSLALWVTVSVTMILFAVLAALTRQAWRLTPLLLPYLLLLGCLAAVWQEAPRQPFLATAPNAWLEGHIVLAVAAYTLLTMASVAGLAVVLQERALKSKRRTALAGMLPSVADSETLQVRLLAGSAALLTLGLLSGMATQYYETGAVLQLDHKTLFSLLTFAVILGLLVAHYRTGVRGRRAARFVLLAYLLLTLAYPGVKFVTDVLLA